MSWLRVFREVGVEVQRWTCTNPEELRELRVRTLGAGAVVSGMLDEHRFHFDPIEQVPPEAWAASTVSLVALMCPGLPTEVTALPSTMRSPWWPVRAAMLRRVALERPEMALPVHHDALLDPHYGVRMFAAYQLSGVLPLPFHPDVPHLIQLMAQPLSGRCFGPWPDWDADHGRKNVRLALLWALGNLGWACRHLETGWGAEAWRALQTALEGVPEEDRSVEQLLAELRGQRGAGIDGEAGLHEILRYAVHRVRLAARLQVEDRFFWFDTAVRGICPPEHPAHPWVFGATPELGMHTLPVRWTGRNPYGL